MCEDPIDDKPRVQYLLESGQITYSAQAEVMDSLVATLEAVGFNDFPGVMKLWGPATPYRTLMAPLATLRIAEEFFELEEIFESLEPEPPEDYSKSEWEDDA